MTRINLIEPKKLLDQHLMAEYRELPMVMGALRRSIKAKKFPDIYTLYTLNKGHVSFFYNKKLFLEERMNLLIEELNLRNYNINPSDRVIDFTVFDNAPCEQINWQPTQPEIDINFERIVTRYREKPNFYKYCGIEFLKAPHDIKALYEKNI